MKKLLLLSLMLLTTVCSYSQQYTGDGISVQSNDTAIPGVHCSATKKLVLVRIKPELMSGTENVYYMKITPSEWFANMNGLVIFFENDFINNQAVTIECTQDCFYDNGNPVWTKIAQPGERRNIYVRKGYVANSISQGPATITNQLSGHRAIEIKITLSDPNSPALLHVWYTMSCNCVYPNPHLLPHPCASDKQDVIIRPPSYVIKPYSVFGRPGSITGCVGCNYQIEWTDYTPDETGFEIWRSTDNVNFTLWHTTAANVTLYGFIKPSGTYYYKVRAKRNSSYSNFVNVTTY